VNPRVLWLVAVVGCSPRVAPPKGVVEAPPVPTVASPPEPPLPLHGGLVVGGAHACAIRARGRVECWGLNDHGQVGLGRKSRSEPPSWVPGMSDVRQLVATRTTTCALRGDGTVWCWGGNEGAEIGDGTGVDQPSPSRVVGLADVAQLSAGSEVCALAGSGDLSCWGNDTSVPFGQHVVRPRPVKIALPVRPIGVAVRGDGGCVWAADGNIACWGELPILHGETPGVAKIDGVQLIQSVPNTVWMGYGESQVCAIRANGEVLCWGFREQPSAHRVLDDLPTLVPNVTGVVELRGGWAFTLARRKDGALVMWGRRDGLEWGQEPRDSGVREVLGLSGVADMSLGGFFCARLLTGKIVCSGDDSDGRLGDGTVALDPRRVREVVEPGAIDPSTWLATLADGEGDACEAASDCGWDDAYAPTRCQKRGGGSLAVCSAPAAGKGECTCTGGRCMLRPSEPPKPPAESCGTKECGLDQAKGQCVIGHGARGNRHPSPDGPRCYCDTGTKSCTFVWREPVRCKQDDDCWFGYDPVRHPAPRPPDLKKHRFAPCVDGEAPPVCRGGMCTFGRPYPC